MDQNNIVTYMPVSFPQINLRVLCFKGWGEGVKDKFPGAVLVTGKYSKRFRGPQGVSSGEQKLMAEMRWQQPQFFVMPQNLPG